MRGSPRAERTVRSSGASRHGRGGGFRGRLNRATRTWEIQQTGDERAGVRIAATVEVKAAGRAVHLDALPAHFDLERGRAAGAVQTCFQAISNLLTELLNALRIALVTGGTRCHLRCLCLLGTEVKRNLGAPVPAAEDRGQRTTNGQREPQQKQASLRYSREQKARRTRESVDSGFART